MKSFSRARLLTGGVLVAVMTFGGLGAAPAGAATPAVQAAATGRTDVPGKYLFQTTHLTVRAAAKAAEAAMDAAVRDGQRVSVAVVDRNGNTLVTLRGDGAGPQSYESAVRKAFTAVSFNAPTSELVRRLETTPTLKDIPGTLFLGGGVPVTVDGAPIAGIGVAGAPSGDLDEKYARAGRDALRH